MTTNLNEIPEGLEIPVELLDASAEDRREVLEWIWYGVVRGVSDLTEYEDCVEDTIGLTVTREQERAIVEHVLAARRAQQATFTEVPEPKLDRAFAALREARIVAEQDFTCCSTCGVAEIGAEQADELDQWLGYVFYHSQDTEFLAENSRVYLHYGIFWLGHLTEEEFNAKPEEELRRLYDELTINLMNEVVIPILKEHGIGVEWNQKVNTRILLTDVELYHPLD